MAPSATSVRSKPLVVFTRGVPGTPNVPEADVRVAPDNPRLPREELLAFIKGASVIITMFHDKVDAEFLDAAGPQLMGVCNFAVGFDNIDLKTCVVRGVQVCNTPDAVTEGTANIAWALILGVARRVLEGDRFVRAGRLEREGNPAITEFLGVHLTGQNLLILGPGRIGKAIAMRGLGFGMRVLYASRSRHLDMELAPLAARRVEIDDGIREADVISISTPLTSETRHLIDARRLGLMKKTAIIINTARGPIIHEAALTEALREQRIWGAGLDVFEFEPKVSEGLLNLDNVILTPHIGSAERHFREIMTEMVSENAQAILGGKKPPNLVQ
ncbi:MAG: D-glycerate dehydrogenase [Pyrinomonadaceae bacterium]|nr:D-glycerate dehydrogenase [Phycisphaerales bacterium]